jgi:Acyl-coenzyme A:6-aminopenicillanic acid acyl-transferase
MIKKATVLCIILFAGASIRAGSDSTITSDQRVAGGPDDFLLVHHLVLRGDNQSIGRALARLAQESYGTSVSSSVDRVRTRAQRHYIEKTYPVLFERMRGVAAAYGKDVNDDTCDFSGLGYSHIRAGCSVVYYPPQATVSGQSIFSRNYDFSTGTLRGTKPPPGELPSTARPYILELHPDQGYASIAICSYDLLCGVLDGTNSEGLTVALLADDELLSRYPSTIEPTRGAAVGLGVQQILRLLLDTCATVDEAKEALLLTKQYYEFLPCHYLVADRHGHAFVWEYSQAHNKEYIVENPGKPLATTNFSLHRYMKGQTPPTPSDVGRVCPRYCALCQGIAKHEGKMDIDFIKENQKRVDAVQPPRSAERPPGRTLWHALYCPETRSLEVSFYLGDRKSDDGKSTIARTDYIAFRLTDQAARGN